jgi:hypothetical protein
MSNSRQPEEESASREEVHADTLKSMTRHGEKASAVQSLLHLLLPEARPCFRWCRSSERNWCAIEMSLARCAHQP